jgi:hypothetical protein
MRWLIRATGITTATGDKRREAAESRLYSFFLTAHGKRPDMRPIIGMLSTIVVISLWTIHPVAARTHHRAPKTTAQATTKPEVKIPVEMKRDPADVALDRKIKGICNGC